VTRGTQPGAHQRTPPTPESVAVGMVRGVEPSSPFHGDPEPGRGQPTRAPSVHASHALLTIANTYKTPIFTPLSTRTRWLRLPLLLPLVTSITNLSDTTQTHRKTIDASLDNVGHRPSVGRPISPPAPKPTGWGRSSSHHPCIGTKRVNFSITLPIPSDPLRSLLILHDDYCFLSLLVFPVFPVFPIFPAFPLLSHLILHDPS